MKRPKGFRDTSREGELPEVTAEHTAGGDETLAEEPSREEVLDLSDRFPGRFRRNVTPAALDASNDASFSPGEEGQDNHRDDVTHVDDQETQEILSGGDRLRVLPWRRPERSEEELEYREAKREFKRAERNRKRRERQERHRFTQQQRAHRRRLLIVLGAVSVLVLSVGIGVCTPLMSVREIDVRGAERVPVATITEALAGVEGKPLALVSDDEVQRSLQELALLESFEVEKIPPHTLRVVVRERQPVVAVPHGEELLLIDPAGVRIAKVERADRPEGIPVVVPVPEDFTSEEFLSMATALRGMTETTRARVTEISAETPQQIVLVLSDGLPVVWGDATQNARKAVVLEAMLTALVDVPLRSVDVSSPDAPVYVPA